MAHLQSRRHLSLSQHMVARRPSGAQPCNLLLILHAASSTVEPRARVDKGIAGAMLDQCRSAKRVQPTRSCYVSRRKLEPRSHVAADCRAVLDACISRVVRTAPCCRGGSRGSAGDAGTEVAAVVAGMVRRVEASAAASRRRSRSQLDGVRPGPSAAGAPQRHPVCAVCERGGSWEGEIARHRTCRVGTACLTRDDVSQQPCVQSADASLSGSAQPRTHLDYQSFAWRLAAQASVYAGTQAASPTRLWACAGPCHRSFHHSCQPPGQGGLCHECTSRR